MNTHCSNIQSQNCLGQLTRTTFEGFKYCIYINNYMFYTDPCFIDDATFTVGNISSQRGEIYAANTFGLRVTNCDFITGPINPVIGLPIYALYLEACDGYIVENNDVTSNAANGYGFFINNSGPNPNLIYNNFFTRLKQAVWAQNVNYNQLTGAGLLINCNDFIYNRIGTAYSPVTYAIGVQSQNLGMVMTPNGPPPPPFQAAGIAVAQGIISFQNQLNYARNRYDWILNCTNENKYYVSTMNNFQLTHGSWASTYPNSNQHRFQPKQQPNCSNPLEVIIQEGYQFNQNAQRSTYCPSNYFPEMSALVLNTGVSNYRNEVITKENEYLTKLDGNRTNVLLNYFEPTSNVTEYLFDSLYAISYLSDTVLIKFLTSSANSTHKKLIISKNSPLSLKVWNYFSQFALNSQDSSFVDSLQFKQNKLSDRMKIESEISYSRNQIGLINNEKIRRCLNDSVLIIDSIFSILNLNESATSPYRLVDAKIRNGDFNSAQNLLNALYNDSVTNRDFVTVLNHVLLLKKDSTYLSSIRNNNSVFLKLDSLANSNNALVEGYARGLLAYIYNYHVQETLLFPEEETTVRRQHASNISDINKPISYNIYPNPTSGELLVLLPSKELFELELLDVTGKIVFKSMVTNDKSIKIKNLSPGLYFATLKKNGQVAYNQKLIVTN